MEELKKIEEEEEEEKERFMEKERMKVIRRARELGMEILSTQPNVAGPSKKRFAPVPKHTVNKKPRIRSPSHKYPDIESPPPEPLPVKEKKNKKVISPTNDSINPGETYSVPCDECRRAKKLCTAQSPVVFIACARCHDIRGGCSFVKDQSVPPIPRDAKRRAKLAQRESLEDLRALSRSVRGPGEDKVRTLNDTFDRLVESIDWKVDAVQSDFESLECWN
ncbi:hypothetical protein Clacol_000227 [Clathrus columnatus]|uniref:Zn(2)-C6 fungal-type domain-containing protein n=1 Tax=Clathrus columnatus TaxID=1419009 RepID=A0AAV5A2C5_9AGAM|nr:hypothetical protein Clacol_000227 [Clathrus columnatus]